MRFIAIVLKHNHISEQGYKTLTRSTLHTIERYDAVTPEKVSLLLEKYDIKWNYPWEGAVHDKELNLIKMPYATRVREKRIACALSHYELWNECANQDETFVILEHDAIFNKDIDFDLPEEYDIVGLNDPYMATRLAHKFDAVVKQSSAKFLPVPVIDRMTTPQGLAGNSAYMIKPSAAVHLCDLVDKYGLWPNDAIMCQQLVPRMGVTSTYYTSTQQLPSTTTL